MIEKRTKTVIKLRIVIVKGSRQNSEAEERSCAETLKKKEEQEINYNLGWQGGAR